MDTEVVPSQTMSSTKGTEEAVSPRYPLYIVVSEHKEEKSARVYQSTLLAKIFQSQAHGVHAQPTVEHIQRPSLEDFIFKLPLLWLKIKSPSFGLYLQLMLRSTSALVIKQ